MTDTTDTERRDRYAAALNPMEHFTADDGYPSMAVRTADELATAAMAIADAELAAVDRCTCRQIVHKQHHATPVPDCPWCKTTTAGDQQ
jgi:DNA-binding helix-hairpin-helix protein with protein kinase domain